MCVLVPTRGCFMFLMMQFFWSPMPVHGAMLGEGHLGKNKSASLQGRASLEHAIQVSQDLDMCQMQLAAEKTAAERARKADEESKRHWEQMEATKKKLAETRKRQLKQKRDEAKNASTVFNINKSVVFKSETLVSQLQLEGSYHHDLNRDS